LTKNQVLDTPPEPQTYEYQGHRFTSNAIGIYETGADSRGILIELDARKAGASREAAWQDAGSLSKKYSCGVRVLTRGEDDPRREGAF